MSEHAITYRFDFQDGHSRHVTLPFEESRLQLPISLRRHPDWTELGYHQCPHCPLDPARTTHCPVAIQIDELVEECADLTSYDSVRVTVCSPERTVSHNTSIQRGLSSVMGLILALSGCPHTEFLKPMARFHLPFACEHETLYRAASMYLLGQYFRDQDGKPADLELTGLAEKYHNLETLNRAMAERIKNAGSGDAPVNAVVMLDMLAKVMPCSIEESLKEIRHLFQAYLDD